ncbi:MAG: hypothetical protein U0163_04250 [Gemmatimonadaceae bacterium]
MLAPSGGTLPRGHWLIEPYLYDVSVTGAFDAKGTRQATPRQNVFGSLAYVLYGVTDRFTFGAIPTEGFRVSAAGSTSTGVLLGDLSLHGQLRLSTYREDSWLPTTSLAVEVALPTGRHDRLGDRPTDGIGAGVYTTSVALYSQTYAWLPTGRILRLRFNATQAYSSSGHVDGVSVYGTGAPFRGSARPGNVLFVDAAGEYSVSKQWVLALDVTYRRQASTRVSGVDAVDVNSQVAPVPFHASSPTSIAYGLAPAIEYNWSPNAGVLLGVRLITAGRNTGASTTPAIAVNIVR